VKPLSERGVAFPVPDENHFPDEVIHLAMYPVVQQ